MGLFLKPVPIPLWLSISCLPVRDVHSKEKGSAKGCCCGDEFLFHHKVMPESEVPGELQLR